MKKFIAAFVLFLLCSQTAQAVSSSARYASSERVPKKQKSLVVAKTRGNAENRTHISYNGTTMDFSKFLNGVNIGTDALLNVFLRSDKCLGLVNDAVKRYGSISDLRHDGEGFHATAYLHGAEQAVNVHLKRIEIAQDGSTITLIGFSSDTLWTNNLLEDFAEGRKIKIPKKRRPLVASMAKMINSVQPR